MADLTKEEGEALVATLAKADDFSPPQRLTSLVEEAIPRLSAGEAQSLVALLMSLVTQLRYRPEWTATELARQLATSPDVELGSDSQEPIVALLARLLSLDSVVTTGKAADVRTDYEHVFSAARILTDIRPVFRDEVDAPPVGAVVVSTLRLDHYTDGEVRSFYLALDEADLRTVKRAVDRALEKSRSAAALLESAGLTTFREDASNGTS